MSNLNSLFTNRLNVLFLEKMILGLCSFLVCFSLFSNILISSFGLSAGLQNTRVMSTFDTDERNQMQWLQRMIREDKIDPAGEYRYPWLHPTVAFIFTKVLASHGYDKSQDFTLAFAYRSISFFSYLAISILIFLVIFQLTKNRLISLLGVLLTVSIQIIFLYSRVIHPEMLQALLMTICLYLIFKSHNFLFTSVACFIAGVAFGTKYAGFMIFPGLILPYILQSAQDRSWKGMNIPLKSFLWIFLFGVIFLGGWLLTNPSVPSNFPRFLENLAALKSYVLDASTANPRLQWLFTLVNQFKKIAFVIWPSIIVFSFYYYQKFSKRDQSLSLLQFFTSSKTEMNKLSLIISIAFGIFFFATQVNNVDARFMLQFYPLLIILGMVGLNYLFRDVLAGSNNKKSLLRSILTIAITGISIHANSDTIHAWENNPINKYNHPRYVVGEWLLINIPKEAKILSDEYVYIPVYFQNVKINYTSLQYLVDFDPDVAVVTDLDIGRWYWKPEGSSFKEKRLVQISQEPYAAKVRDMWSPLLNSGIWTLAFENKMVAVFCRRDRLANNCKNLQN